jgi:hypothetical protein
MSRLLIILIGEDCVRLAEYLQEELQNPSSSIHQCPKVPALNEVMPTRLLIKGKFTLFSFCINAND